jgi:hypothetical protein
MFPEYLPDHAGQGWIVSLSYFPENNCGLHVPKNSISDSNSFTYK